MKFSPGQMRYSAANNTNKTFSNRWHDKISFRRKEMKRVYGENNKNYTVVSSEELKAYISKHFIALFPMFSTSFRLCFLFCVLIL